MDDTGAVEMDDDTILRAMLEQARQLCQTDDALMKGQYEHLLARVDALLALRTLSERSDD